MKRLILITCILLITGCKNSILDSTSVSPTRTNLAQLDNEGGSMNKDLHIYIFDTATTGTLGDTRESVWAVLQAIPLETSDYTITEELITSYDWDTQTFTIINEWGERGESARGLMWGGSAAFLVTFDGQRLFGGRIMQAISPRRFNYPAMMLMPDLNVSSSNKPFSGPLTYSFFETSSVKSISNTPHFLADDPAIGEQVRQHLADLGKLQ